MSSESSKWSCEYCTYENWQQSTKCVMCRAQKPPKLIADEGRRQEIYSLCEDRVSRGDSLSPLIEDQQFSPSREEGLSDTLGKWSCHMCTFFNWPRAAKCTQCLTPRRRSSPVTVSNLSDNLHPLNICVNENVLIRSHPNSPDGQQVEEKDGGSENDRNRTRCNMPQSASSPASVSQSQGHGASAGKWNCVICTYENWPRSSHCVMCRIQRGRSDTGGASLGRASVFGKQSPEGDVLHDYVGVLGDKFTDHLDMEGKSSSMDNRLLTRVTRPSSSDNLVGATAASSNNYEYEKRLRRLRRRIREADWSWLNACLGVVEGDPNPVEAYLSGGGDPTRQLTQSEVSLLSRPSSFDIGHTLVHLAIRFHREDLLATLLSQIEGSRAGVKRVPSYVAPDLAADIQRHVAAGLRQRKGSFPCYYMTELTTFSLPSDIEFLPSSIQDQLYNELLDRDAQKELDEEAPIINWSLEICERLGSRLYALWNRTAGDCLLDSILQATWGVFDRDNTIRRALSDSLNEGGHIFYPRWKEYEGIQAQLLDFSLNESQWAEDWAGLLSIASQPGASLEQLHVFALAHIFRRPIIIYGVKYVKSFRGEALGYARFEGVYLPLLWEPSFCWQSPISLGYTRGHFSALVPMEPDSGNNLGAGASLRDSHDLHVTFLPLMTHDRKLMPVHFLSKAELGREESILRRWLDVCETERGILVAQQHLHRRPLLVAQMVEEWLNYYRKLVQTAAAPFHRPSIPPSATATQTYSSDGDSEDD